MSPLPPASITDSLRLHFRQSVETLRAKFSHDGGSAVGFEQARQDLETLALTNEEFSLAVNRLANAQHYLRGGERGAACFELRLLLQSLEK